MSQRRKSPVGFLSPFTAFIPFDKAITESGRRLTRSKLLAKRPHSGGHRPGKKLNNVRKNPGRTREDLDFLAIRNSREIPAKFHENLAKFDQNFAKF